MPGPLDGRLVRNARATAPYLVVCGLIGALVAGCALAQAALLAHAIATPTVPVALLGVVAARAVLAWGQEVAAHRCAAGVKSQLRARLLDHVVATRGAGRTGEVTALVTRGVDALDPYFSGYLPQLFRSAIVPFTVLVALAVTDLAAAGIVLVTLPLIPLFGALIGMCAAARTRRQWRTLESLAGHFADVVAGLPTLKAFGRAKAQARQIAEVTDAHRRASLATLRVAFCSALVLELAATLSVALVAVSVGLRLVSGSLTFETALFVLILAPEAYLPLRQAAAQFHAGQEGVAAAGRVFAILDSPVEPAVAKVHPLRVRDLTVAYEGRPAVGPFSFDLDPGITALTGPSGTGKSTVIAALLGLVTPTSGPIAGGAEWHRLIAWMPQRPYIFTGTIADNIAIAVPGASGAAVRRAAILAGVTFAALTAGAAGLSAGERQRVSLARVALRCDLLDTPLLLLDEPTAHLDAATEIDVVATIEALAHGRTTLLATHRRALLERADRVVRLAAVLV